MAAFPGWQKYGHFAAESSWGTTPGTPSYVVLPYQSCTIKATPIKVVPDLYCGLRQKIHQETVAYTVGGQITFPLPAWQDGSNVSIAQHLIGWATNQPTGFALDSKLVEIFDASNANKRWNGCRVNSLTLSGTPNQPIMCTLDIIGKTETASGITAQTLVKNTEIAVAQSLMYMGTCVFEIPSATAVSISSFTLTLQNQLNAKFMNGTTINSLTAGERMWTLAFSIDKAAGTYDVLRTTIAESATTAQINLQGLHKGTGASGTNTTLTLDIDRMDFGDVDDVDDRNALVEQNISYDVLTPASSDNDVDLTWGVS